MTNPPRPLVFTDLDDTLFSTRRKLPPDAEGLTRATTANNGHHSWMTQGQMQFFSWLTSTTDVVPVTARSAEAFARVHLNFSGPAILSMGAVIVSGDGQSDPDWADRLARISGAHGPALARLLTLVPATVGPTTTRSWIVEEGGLPVYLCAKANATDPSVIEACLDGVVATLADNLPEGVRLTRNGNNLAVIPNDISKRSAVAHLVDQLRGSTERAVIGIGDSLSDLGFMSLCDFAMFPRAAQIAETGLSSWRRTD